MDEQTPSRNGNSVRGIYRKVLSFLRSLASRIDLRHFPGSCCG